MRQQVLDAVQFLAADIDQENIRQVGAGGQFHFPNHTMLHEKDGQDQHHAHAQGGQHGGGLITRAIQVRQAVANRGLQMHPGARQKGTQHAQSERRHAEDDHQQRAQSSGEPAPDYNRIGERRGDGTQPQQDDDGNDPLRLALAQAHPPALLRLWLLHHSAQHQVGPDGTNLQQRRQAEKDGGQNAGAQARQRGMPGKTKIQVYGQRTSQQGGENPLHAQPQRTPINPPTKPSSTVWKR